MSDTPAPFGPSIPQGKPRPDQSWFGLRKLTVLLLAALGVVVLIGLGLGVRATLDRDEIADRAAEATVGAVLETLQRDVLALLLDYGNLVADPDMADILMGHARRAALIGRWVTRYSEVDIALVVDRSGHFLQMAESGELRPSGEMAQIQRDLTPFVGPWLQRRPQPGDNLTGIVEVRGELMLVAASAIRLPPRQTPAPAATDIPSHLIVLRHLERDLAETLHGEFDFNGTRLVRSPDGVGRNFRPVRLWNGEIGGYVTWESTPLQPTALAWAPFALVVPLVVGAGFLVRRMRSMAEREQQAAVSKDADAVARERLIADIRTGIRQLSWNLTEGVLILEAAGEVRYANAAAGRLVGKPAESILGTSYIAACEERFPALAAHLRAYIKTDPGKWSGDASWFSTVGTDGRMIRVGIHEFRRGEGDRLVGLLISETVWNQLGDPLDRIGIGVICLDGGGRLLAANRLAADLCRLIRVPLDGAGPDQAATQLLELLKPGLERSAAGQVSSLALRHPGGTEPVIATLIPMSGGQPGPGEQGVFVLLRDPGRTMAADTALLTDLFGMTPAECRIAVRTTAGASAEAIAEELGLSPHTVRNHLKSVMRKTATSKQSETVALLWRMAAYTGGPTAE